MSARCSVVLLAAGSFLLAACPAPAPAPAPPPAPVPPRVPVPPPPTPPPPKPAPASPVTDGALGTGEGGGGRSWWCITLPGDALPKRCPDASWAAPCPSWDHIDVDLRLRSSQGLEAPDELVTWYARTLAGCFADTAPTVASLVVRIQGEPDTCPTHGANTTVTGALADPTARACVRNVFRYRVLPAAEAHRVGLMLDLKVRVREP